jgi:alpha/beta superfamily hydrolase
MASRHVVFSHGQESGPWGTKISAMSEVAKSEGWNVDSVDYRGVNDPRDRVTRLLSFCRDLRGDLVLVGSSMGGYVATSASALLHARGLFLMAPAFYMPGMEQLTSKPAPCAKAIVHGWRDDVVPVDNSIRFAREHTAMLHILDSDHRLHNELSFVNYLFEHFLVSLDLPKRR